MSACCTTLVRKFDADHVAREIASREKRGAGPTTSRMIDLLASAGPAGTRIEGASLLDIGAGLGDVQAALFGRGLATATHVEASSAYSQAARELAAEAGWDDRVRFEVGDFLEFADRLPDADLVTLDRVVCCHPDMPGLIDRSARHARRVCALSAPRDGWLVRVAIGVQNVVRRLRRYPFRTFVHPWAAMNERLEAAGFVPAAEAGTPMWRIVVYRRVNPATIIV